MAQLRVFQSRRNGYLIGCTSNPPPQMGTRAILSWCEAPHSTVAVIHPSNPVRSNCQSGTEECSPSWVEQRSSRAAHAPPCEERQVQEEDARSGGWHDLSNLTARVSSSGEPLHHLHERFYERSQSHPAPPIQRDYHAVSPYHERRLRYGHFGCGREWMILS